MGSASVAGDAQPRSHASRRAVLPWRQATERALYGPGGFYLRPGGPGAHFRTSAHVGSGFAAALLTLADRAGLRTVVDVGSGRGELLREMHHRRPDLELVGVERAPRPPDLPAEIGWLPAVPSVEDALVVANEWLDNVAIDVVTVTADGPRVLLVDVATGEEVPGSAPPPEDLAWLDRWWPLSRAREGDRAEVGRPRDEAWAEVVSKLGRGLAVAVDYDTTVAERTAGRFAAGTLAGYRLGRTVVPVPDGSCDVTSHVALDACAAAGAAAGATSTVVLRQRQALECLGLAAHRPPRDLAVTEPAAYLAALREAGEHAELLDADGLGRFGWLVQGVGVDVSRLLSARQ